MIPEEWKKLSEAERKKRSKRFHASPSDLTIVRYGRRIQFEAVDALRQEQKTPQS